MQDDYNRFIRKSIRQAQCNYEDIFDDCADDDVSDRANDAGCYGAEAAQMGKKKCCAGAEAEQKRKKGCCGDDVQSEQGRRNGCCGGDVQSEQGRRSGCCGGDVQSEQGRRNGCCGGIQSEQENNCMSDKMYRPERNLPVMVFIEPQTFGKTYNEAEALQRGTLFPALDKPFYGRGGKC